MELLQEVIDVISPIENIESLLRKQEAFSFKNIVMKLQSATINFFYNYFNYFS